MAYGIDVSNILGAFGQLQQANAARRAAQEAQDARRRSGISAITTTAGSIIGGAVAGAYSGGMGTAAGAAVGGAIGGAVGGMIGGEPMSGGQVAQHGANIYSAYQMDEMKKQQFAEAQQAEKNKPVNYKIEAQPVMGSDGVPTGETSYLKVGMNAEGAAVSREPVPASQVKEAPKQEGPKIPSEALTVAGETAGEHIINQLGGMPAVTEDAQKDLDRIQRLAKVTGPGEAAALKQISKIQAKYTPEESKSALKPSVETVYRDGKKVKGVYDPMTNTFMFGKEVVPAAQISLEPQGEGDWRPQKMLVQTKPEGEFEPQLLSYNPDTQEYKLGGKVIPAESVKPIPTGSSMKLYDSSGNLVMEQTSGGSLQAPVKTEMQKNIVENQVTLGSLDTLSNQLDEKLLTWPEQFQVMGLEILEKSGFPISHENQKRISDMSNFQANTVDLAAKYIKQISGVAVSEAEAKRLRRVLPQVGDSPSEFKAKLQSARSRLHKINAIYQSILSGDLPKKPGKGVQDSVEDYLDSQQLPDAVINKVGNDLMQKNKWDEKRAAIEMRKMGLI